MGGKKRHSKDRLYVTNWEHKNEWGGYKGKEMRPLSRQPLNCCAQSQQPYENPVCSKDGDIFETLNIVPFLKYYKKNPCTGADMKRDELVKQKFEKDPTDIYSQICPVSKKVLTDNMKVCAIRTTGNVYSGTVIDELCKKQKYWKDLLTDEPFKGPADIITLQDPINCDARRLVTNFWYIKNKVDLDLKKLKGEETEKAVIEHTGLGKRYPLFSLKNQNHGTSSVCRRKKVER